MAMPDPVRVKICGLTRRRDVEMAADLGADYVGVVLTGGFGRSVDAAAAPGLVRDVPATPVAVLVDEPLDVAATAARALGAGVVQLHGEETPEVAEALRELGPWDVWKAVRVRSAADASASLASMSSGESAKNSTSSTASGSPAACTSPSARRASREAYRAARFRLWVATSTVNPASCERCRSSSNVSIS